MKSYATRLVLLVKFMYTNLETGKDREVTRGNGRCLRAEGVLSYYIPWNKIVDIYCIDSKPVLYRLQCLGGEINNESKNMDFRLKQCL